MSLSVTTERIGRHLVLSLEGALDVSSLPRLSDALSRHLRPSDSAVLDLDGITVLDDAAVGILLGAALRRNETNERLTLVCNNPSIIDRLRGSGLAANVLIVSSVHDIASD